MARKSRLLQLLAILFAFTLIAAACGDDDDDGGATDPPESTDDGSTDDDGGADEEPADDSGDDGGEEEPTDDDGEATDDGGEEAAIGDPEIDTLRICQAPAFTGLAAHIAVTKGILEARGITGEFVQCPSGPANAAALISRQVDVVGNTPDNMLGIRNADFDVVMFGQAVDTHFFDVVINSSFGTRAVTRVIGNAP